MGNVPNKIREDFTLLYNPMKISSAKLLLVATGRRWLILAGVCLRGKEEAGTPARARAQGGSSLRDSTWGKAFSKNAILNSQISDHCCIVSNCFLYLLLYCLISPCFAFPNISLFEILLKFIQLYFHMLPNSQHCIFPCRVALINGAGRFLHLICAGFIYTHIPSNLDLQESKQEESSGTQAIIIQYVCI